MIQPNTIRDTPITRKRLVVIGNGMAGARFVEDLIGLDPSHAFDICIFGDEPYGNYNRILHSNVLNCSQDAKEIFLNPLAWYADNRVTFHAGKKVTKVDRASMIVYADGVEEAYDTLVFATGSRPFVPPIAGTSLHGVFVFRTLDDCRNIAEYAKDCKRAVDFVPRLGIENLRKIIVDSLGIVASLDAEVEKTMAAYVDPWLERNQPVYAGQFAEPRKVSLPVVVWLSRKAAEVPVAAEAFPVAA